MVQNVTGPLNFTDVNASDTSSDGIFVSNHKGNVTMTRVTADSNVGSGAVINNHAGGNVTINSSYFNNNDEAGVLIISSGIVTLNTVTADGNDSLQRYLY